MLAASSIYIGLFLNAFIAATLLPALSEVSFAAALKHDTYTPFLLFIAVTSGNILGSLLNWWMGTKLVNFQHRKWFPFSETHIAIGHKHFERYGKWSLLFAWLPIIGDPLTLVAGILKCNFKLVLTLVSIGKATRYGIIWALIV